MGEDQLHSFYKEIDSFKDLVEDGGVKLPDDYLICECFSLSAHDLRTVLQNEVCNLENIQRKLPLGTGCTTCIKFKDDWLGRL